MKTEQNAIVSALTLAYGAAATRSQLMFATSIAFETLPMMAANPKFKMSAFARMVEEASNHSIDARTVANAGVLANQFHLKYGARIGQCQDGMTEANIADFANFIADEVKNTTYRLTLADLVAFCKAEPSAQDKRVKAEEAAKDAAAALADAKAAATLKESQAKEDATLALAEKAQKDAQDTIANAAKAEQEAIDKAAKEEAAKKQAMQQAESLKEENELMRAEQAAKAIELEAMKAEQEAARQHADSFAIQVRVNADGSPDVVFALNQSPEFLAAVAKIIGDAAKALKGKQLKAA